MFTQEQLEFIANKISEDMAHDYVGPWTTYAGDYKVTVSEIPDYDTVIDDYDCYGKVAPARGHEHRPDGFDGSAYKVWSQSDQWWWQPPADVTEPEVIRSILRVVTDILSYGWTGYELSVYSTCDCCDQPVREAQSFSYGWEPFSTEHGADILDVLLSDFEVVSA